MYCLRFTTFSLHFFREEIGILVLMDNRKIFNFNQCSSVLIGCVL